MERRRCQDAEAASTVPLEQPLRSIDNLHELTSTSADGIAAVGLEFDDGN